MAPNLIWKEFNLVRQAQSRSYCFFRKEIPVNHHLNIVLGCIGTEF